VVQERREELEAIHRRIVLDHHYGPAAWRVS